MTEHVCHNTFKRLKQSIMAYLFAIECMQIEYIKIYSQMNSIKDMSKEEDEGCEMGVATEKVKMKKRTF